MLEFLTTAFDPNHIGHTQLHGSTDYSMNAPGWHKTDDPWGAYLRTDGQHVNQGGTKWVDTSAGDWQNYNVHGVSTANHEGSSQLSFIGSVGVGGGQGNSDCIYNSCDDHSQFGVSGAGPYGPGNGGDIGNLWNPATQHGASHGLVAKELAVPAASAVTSDAKPAIARPSLGHYYLCGPALIIGAFNATAELGTGKDISSWAERVRHHATAAAGAVSPLGEHILEGVLPAPAQQAA